MNREDRAKQFMPFDALRGLRKELSRRAELHNRIERVTLDQSQMQEISDALNQLSKGSKAKITYYSGGKYNTEIFTIQSIDDIEKFILTSQGKIYFDDLFFIEIIS